MTLSRDRSGRFLRGEEGEGGGGVRVSYAESWCALREGGENALKVRCSPLGKKKKGKEEEFLSPPTTRSRSR